MRRNHRVYADDFAAHIEQRTAAVTRIDSRVSLKKILEI